MELSRDLNFSSEMFINLVMQFQMGKFVDGDLLYYFKEGEGLDTLSNEELTTRLRKSLGIDLDKVAQSVKKKLTDLVNIAHIAIDIANAEKTTKKARTEDHPPSKKSKTEEGSVSLDFKCVIRLLLSIDILTCIACCFSALQLVFHADEVML